MKTSTLAISTLYALSLALGCISCAKTQTQTQTEGNKPDSAPQSISPTEQNIAQPSIEEQIKVLLDDEWGSWDAGILPSRISPRLFEVQFDDFTQLVLIDTVSGLVTDYLNNQDICAYYNRTRTTAHTVTEWERTGSYSVSGNTLEIRNIELEQTIYNKKKKDNRHDTLYILERTYLYNLASQRFEVISQDSVLKIDKRKR